MQDSRSPNFKIRSDGLKMNDDIADHLRDDSVFETLDNKDNY